MCPRCDHPFKPDHAFPCPGWGSIPTLCKAIVDGEQCRCDWAVVAWD